MSFACAQCCYVLLQQMTRNDSENFLPLSSKLRAWAEWASLQETTPALQRHRPWPELLPKKLKEKSRIHWTTHCIHHCRIASFEQNCFMLSWLQKDLPNNALTSFWKYSKRSILERSWHHRKRKTKWPAPTTSATINVAVRKAELPPVFSFWGLCKVPYELIPWHAVVLSTGSVAWVACVSCVLWSLNGSKCKHKRSINVKSSKLFKAVQIWIDSKRLKQSQILLNSPNLSKIVVICAGILAERLYC